MVIWSLCHKEIWDLILRHAKDKNPKDDYGRTPLAFLTQGMRLRIRSVYCGSVESPSKKFSFANMHIDEC